MFNFLKGTTNDQISTSVPGPSRYPKRVRITTSAALGSTAIASSVSSTSSVEFPPAPANSNSNTGADSSVSSDKKKNPGQKRNLKDIEENELTEEDMSITITSMKGFKKALWRPLLDLSASHFLRPLNETPKKKDVIDDSVGRNSNNSNCGKNDNVSTNYKQLTCYMCKNRKTSTYFT
jgi:hypothetical protein